MTMRIWIALALLAGCQQGRGERCQTTADCANGLVCSQAEPKTCGGEDTEQFDAEQPPDAPDAPDAAPDAPPDAAPLP